MKYIAKYVLQLPRRKVTMFVTDRKHMPNISTYARRFDSAREAEDFVFNTKYENGQLIECIIYEVKE